MHKKLSLIAIFIMLIFSVSLVGAQEETLTYGEPIEGEMTNETYEFNYTLAARSGEVVIIELERDLDSRDFTDPILLLTDSDGNTLVDTTEASSFGSALIATEIPEDDSYTVTATRELGAEGSTVGIFTIEAKLATPLEAGKLLTDETDNESGDKYYTVRMSEDFGISYLKTGGDFFPEIAINRIDPSDGSLTEVTTIQGDELTEAAVGIFQSDTLYIVTLGRPIFSFSFGRLTADYELEILTFE